jgi:hypothetical protein
MGKYLILAAVSIVLGAVIFASELSAREWVVFDEQIPQGVQTVGTIEVSKKGQFEGDACLQYTGAGLAWAGVTELDFDLTGISYDDAFLEFYAAAQAGVTLEIRLLGPGGQPDMGSRVHPQLTGTEYEQIKIPLRHFVDRATAKIPRTLDAFTGGTSIVDQFMIAATDGPVRIDNVRIADTEERGEQHSVCPSGKLAISWAKLKSTIP